MKNILLIITLLLVTLTCKAQYTFNQIDVWAGSSGSTPKYLTNFNGNIYFQSFEGSPFLKKLYKSDGTIAGTSIVSQNLNGASGYSPESLKPFNGTLFFTAFVSGVGTELFKTDGTEAGTTLIKDIRTGTSSGMDFNTNNDKELFVEFNNELYFRANTNTSIQLWKTNGTETGTVAVKNFEASTNGAPQYIATNSKQILGVVYNNELFFAVNRGSLTELWKTNGTEMGTVALKTDFKDPIADMIVFNNKLFFTSSGDTGGNEIWQTDGTALGTTLWHDIFPNNLNPALGISSNPEDLFIYNNELYFTAKGYNSSTNQLLGRELYKSDGMTVTLLKDIKTGVSNSGLGFLPRFLVYNNKLLFLASDDTTSNQELWETDGTEMGTIKLVSSTDTGSNFEMANAVIFNSKVFYHNFQQLWATNGTAAGTEQLTSTGSGSSILQTASESLLKFDSKIWFGATSNATGNELTSLASNPLSITDYEKQEVLVYPNPATEVININSKSKINNVSLYSSLGKLVYFQKGNAPINVSQLTQGIYILRIKNDTSVINKKILVK